MATTASQSVGTAPRWQRWFLAGLFLLLVGVGAQYVAKVGGNDHRSAFLRWRTQILHIDRGGHIYDEHNYPNPPIMALLLRPLAELPPLFGSLLWFWLKVGMAFLVYHWVFRLVQDEGRPFPVWARVLAVALTLRPIAGDLTHGNVNIFILFIVVGALVAFRAGRDATSGLVLGLAIACKVTPALFVPYFLWKRAWRALAGCGIGLVLSLWLVPGLFLGFERNVCLLGEWTDNMIVPYVVHGKVTTEHQNQSLPGLVYRLTTRLPSFTEWDQKIWSYVPVAYHNLLSLDPALAGLLVKLCMFGFAIIVVWTCRTPSLQRRRWRLAAEYSLVMLGMLLFSERTWKHHCVSLVLPIALLVYCLATQRLAVGRRRLIIVVLIMSSVLMASTGSGLFGSGADEIAKLAEVYGAYVWANLLLVVALVALLRQRPSVGAYQSPHSRLLRMGLESPTLTPAFCSERPESAADDQSTESIRDARDSGGRPAPHS
jgi:hypothetical protein